MLHMVIEAKAHAYFFAGLEQGLANLRSGLGFGIYAAFGIYGRWNSGIGQQRLERWGGQRPKCGNGKTSMPAKSRGKFFFGGEMAEIAMPPPRHGEFYSWPRHTVEDENAAWQMTLRSHPCGQEATRSGADDEKGGFHRRKGDVTLKRESSVAESFRACRLFASPRGPDLRPPAS